jgi:hypothetical protein
MPGMAGLAANFYPRQIACVGQPGIVDGNRIAERRDQRAQFAAEIAETDDPHWCARKHEAALVAGQSKFLSAGAEGSVSGGEPVGKRIAIGTMHLAEGLHRVIPESAE